MKKTVYFSLLICVSWLCSCSSKNLNVDISAVKLKMNFVNLDSIEFNVNTVNELKKQVQNADLQHEEILSYQFNYCLSIGRVDDDSSYVSLKKFTNDPYFKRVHESVKKQMYPHLESINAQVLDGFKRLKKHEKTFVTPKNIIYINSAFSSSIFSTEHEIGISLERYLSDTTKVIKELPADPFYDWVIKKFNQKFLVRDIFMGWITTHLATIDEGTFADKMIQYGKALYLTKAAMPDTEDAVILRYDDSQYKWARENEFNFWDYLVKQKLLYTTNERDQSNMLNDGPNTQGLPSSDKSPDRLGQFLGYQMVLSYVKEHPKITLKELLNLPTTEIIKEYKVK